MAARVRQSAGGIGQDNREVYRDRLRLSEREIERLARDKVI